MTTKFESFKESSVTLSDGITYTTSGTATATATESASGNKLKI